MKREIGLYKGGGFLLRLTYNFPCAFYLESMLHFTYVFLLRFNYNLHFAFN